MDDLLARREIVMRVIDILLVDKDTVRINLFAITEGPFQITYFNYDIPFSDRRPNLGDLVTFSFKIQHYARYNDARTTS